ncbi:MAG TPA: universal stress protein [Limnochordales bacterium]
MFKRILVAIDGSANAWNALDHAAALAKAMGTETLGLVHVRPSLATLAYSYGFDGAGAPYGSFAERMVAELQAAQNRSRELLQEAEERVRAAGLTGAQVVHHAEEGSVVRQILDVVRREGYELLVMGSRGMGRAAGLILGSVSQSLVANLPCSVMIVEYKGEKEPAKGAKEPAAAEAGAGSSKA